MEHTTPPVFLGIDPGLDGGLVFMSPSYPGMPPTIIDALPMPVFEGTKRVVDIVGLRNAIMRVGPIIAIVEAVGAMPGQGVTSMWNFGFSTGVIHGLLLGLGIPMRTVRPQEWQRVAFKGVPVTLDKPSILFAARTWPNRDWRKNERCRTPHDGMTDAAGIVYWYIKTSTGMS